MTSKVYGFAVPSQLFETTNVQVQGTKGDQIGIRMTNTLVVTEVGLNSIAHLRLLIGDVIMSVNGNKVENRTQFTELYSKISQSGPTFSLDVVMMRPLVVMPVKPSQIPKGYEIIQGCKYHVAVMYKIPGCKLSLSVKAYMSKVYVTRTEDGTLAGLSLKIGDAILDIEGTPVSTVQETSEALFKALRAKGYATMVVEQPTDAPTKNLVRQALTIDRTAEFPLQKDVVLICKTELKRFTANPDMTAKKEILRDDKKSKRGEEAGRVQVSDKSEDTPIACDSNPNLLMPVPTPNFQIQQQSQIQDPTSSQTTQK